MSPSERLQQVEELYHSAREREPDGRAAFLAEACAPAVRTVVPRIPDDSKTVPIGEVLLLKYYPDEWTVSSRGTGSQSTGVDLLEIPPIARTVIPGVPDVSLAIPIGNMLLLKEDGDKRGARCRRAARGAADAGFVHVCSVPLRWSAALAVLPPGFPSVRT
jgi:hypothetical protein